MKFFVVSLAMMFLISPSSSGATECSTVPSGHVSFNRMQVTADSGARVYFQNKPITCSEKGVCSQKTKAYLLAGDVVDQLAEEANFICSAYHRNGLKPVVGWLTKANLHVFSPWIKDESQNSVIFPVKWSQQYKLSARKDIDAKLNESFAGDGFEGLVDGKPGKVSNCLRALAEKFSTNNQEYKIYLNQKAECRVFQIIKDLKPAKTSFVSDYEFNSNSLKELPPALDLQSGVESIEAVRKAELAGKSLAQFNESARIQSFNPVKLSFHDAEGSEVQLSLVAMGDFDGDGLEDLILVELSTIAGGSYGNTQVFVLTRKKSNEVFHKIAVF